MTYTVTIRGPTGIERSASHQAAPRLRQVAFVELGGHERRQPRAPFTRAGGEPFIGVPDPIPCKHRNQQALSGTTWCPDCGMVCVAGRWRDKMPCLHQVGYTGFGLCVSCGKKVAPAVVRCEHKRVAHNGYLQACPDCGAMTHQADPITDEDFAVKQVKEPLQGQTIGVMDAGPGNPGGNGARSAPVTEGDRGHQEDHQR